MHGRWRRWRHSRSGRRHTRVGPVFMHSDSSNNSKASGSRQTLPTDDGCMLHDQGIIIPLKHTRHSVSDLRGRVTSKKNQCMWHTGWCCAARNKKPREYWSTRDADDRRASETTSAVADEPAGAEFSEPSTDAAAGAVLTLARCARRRPALPSVGRKRHVVQQGKARARAHSGTQVSRPLFRICIHRRRTLGGRSA